MAKRNTTVESAEPVESVVKAEKGTATVTWRGGVRVYSKEQHGADFKALAQEFADKKEGTVA